MSDQIFIYRHFKRLFLQEIPIIPIQLIVTTELSSSENLWLKNLTNRLSDMTESEILIKEYENHKNKKLYESVMDLIVRANKSKFQEVKSMSVCDALKELMKDELDAKREEGLEEGKKEQAAMLIKIVESAMRNFHVDLETACRGIGTTLEEYNGAKQMLAETHNEIA